MSPIRLSAAEWIELDAEDLARVFTSFRGQPLSLTPTKRYVRTVADGADTAYVLDEDTGMVYLLD